MTNNIDFFIRICPLLDRQDKWKYICEKIEQSNTQMHWTVPITQRWPGLKSAKFCEKYIEYNNTHQQLQDVNVFVILIPCILAMKVSL